MNPKDPSKTARKEVLLATPAELRDRIRQLGKSAAQRAEPRFAIVAGILDRHAGLDGALLPILHAVQDALGCVPGDVVPDIAAHLNLSRAEVHGVITYYHHFRSEPPGRHRVEVCRAESCQAVGSESLWHDACTGLDLPPEGGTTADGGITMQTVYCLGLCALSPAAMVDGKPYARLTSQRLERLLAAVDA